MELNGKLEEQAYELRTLKEQSLERYVEPGQASQSGRVAALAGAADPGAAAPGSTQPLPVAVPDGGHCAGSGPGR